MIEQASWTHGHGMVIEYESRIKSTWRAGFYIRLVGKPDTTNWLHFAIPTPVIVRGNRLSIDSAMIRVRSKSTFADVTNVHVFDGEKRIARHDGLNLSPSSFGLERFDVPGHPDIRWGVGVTVGVRFSGATDEHNTIEFASAGVDFKD